MGHDHCLQFSIKAINRMLILFIGSVHVKPPTTKEVDGNTKLYEPAMFNLTFEDMPK